MYGSFRQRTIRRAHVRERPAGAPRRRCCTREIVVCILPPGCRVRVYRLWGACLATLRPRVAQAWLQILWVTLYDTDPFRAATCD